MSDGGASPIGRRLRRRRFGARHWLLLVVVLGLAARLGRVALGFPIWGDEAFVACNFLSRDLRGLLQPLEFGMVVPIGWLVPTHALSRLLGAEPWVLRLPALVAGTAALLLFVRFARRELGRTTGLVAAALFAASYYLVRHSGEVKPYAFDLLAGLLVTASAWRLLATPSARDWLAFTAVAAVAVWCSYPAAFVASGALLVLGGSTIAGRKNRGIVDRQDRRALLPWLLATGAIAASFIAMYLLVGREQQWSEQRIADARHWDEHFLPLARPWLWPWWLLRELTGNMLAYPNGGPDFGSSATFLLVVAGGVAFWRSGRRRELLLLVSPLLPMVVASALRRYPFGGSARTTLHLAVPVCLLAASGLVALLRAWRGPRAAVRAARLVAAAMSLWLVATIATDVAHPFKSAGDVKNREAIAWLRDQTRRGDRWLLFGTFASPGASAPEASATAPEGLAGARDAFAGAPDLGAWRGSAGRLRYGLLHDGRAAGAELLFAPAPTSLAPRAATRVWLVVYRDNEAPFPEAAWSAWRDAIERDHGAPITTRRFLLGPASRDPDSGDAREESLTFVGFDSRR